MNRRTYDVYFLTNWSKKILYVGVTNNLTRRLNEHISGNSSGFTNKYKCTILIYYEQYDYINNAIHREKEIKGWRREKKNQLVKQYNPEWRSLNSRFIRKYHQ